MASAIFVLTFVDIHAAIDADAISTKSVFAATDSGPDRILASGVVMATSVVQRALVDIGATLGTHAIASITRSTNA